MSGRTPTHAAARSHAGPRVVGVGMALVVIAYLGYNAGDYHPQATAPPRPPSPAPSSPSAKPPKTIRPSSPVKPKPHRAADDSRVVAVAAPKARGGGRTAPRHPRPIAPSGPKPRPPAVAPPVTTSCQVGVTVLVLNACLNLGADR